MPQTFNESWSQAPSSRIAAKTSSENDRKTLKQESQHLGTETATKAPYHTRKLLKNSDSQIIQSEAKRTSYMYTTICIERTHKRTHSNMHRNWISRPHHTANLMKHCENMKRRESPNWRDEQPKQMNPMAYSELERKSRIQGPRSKIRTKKAESEPPPDGYVR
jgi:hypothetical protein